MGNRREQLDEPVRIRPGVELANGELARRLSEPLTKFPILHQRVGRGDEPGLVVRCDDQAGLAVLHDLGNARHGRRDER